MVCQLEMNSSTWWRSVKLNGSSSAWSQKHLAGMCSCERPGRTVEIHSSHSLWDIPISQEVVVDWVRNERQKQWELSVCEVLLKQQNHVRKTQGASGDDGILHASHPTRSQDISSETLWTKSQQRPPRANTSKYKYHSTKTIDILWM